MKRVPYVFELRDLWPESIRAVGAMRDSATLWQLEKLELHLYRQAALIVSVTNAFRDNLVGRGIDPEKITVITNGIDTTRFTPSEKDAVAGGASRAAGQVRRRLHRHARHGACARHRARRGSAAEEPAIRKTAFASCFSVPAQASVT